MYDRKLIFFLFTVHGKTYLRQVMVNKAGRQLRTCHVEKDDQPPDQFLNRSFHRTKGMRELFNRSCTKK
jgi:hypothetical protein